MAEMAEKISFLDISLKSDHDFFELFELSGLTENITIQPTILSDKGKFLTDRRIKNLVKDIKIQ